MKQQHEINWVNIIYQSIVWPTNFTCWWSWVGIIQTTKLSLLSNVSHGFTHQSPLTIITTRREPTLMTTFTRPTLMIGYGLQQPPSMTSSSDHLLQLMCNQLQLPILGSNNHLQWQTLIKINFDDHLLDANCILWRQSSCNQLQDHLCATQLLHSTTTYNYEFQRKSRLIFNFNNHLKLRVPTTTYTINFHEKHIW